MYASQPLRFMPLLDHLAPKWQILPAIPNEDHQHGKIANTALTSN